MHNLHFHWMHVSNFLLLLDWLPKWRFLTRNIISYRRSCIMFHFHEYILLSAHQHVHQNLSTMAGCLLFDVIDLLAVVYLLGHRSVVSSGFRAPPCFFLRDHYCILPLCLPACLPVLSFHTLHGCDCSIDLRCSYEMDKSNEAQVPANLTTSTKWPTGIASDPLALHSVEPFQQLRHFPLWASHPNPERQIGEEAPRAGKQMFLSQKAFVRKQRQCFQPYIDISH